MSRPLPKSAIECLNRFIDGQRQAYDELELALKGIPGTAETLARAQSALLLMAKRAGELENGSVDWRTVCPLSNKLAMEIQTHLISIFKDRIRVELESLTEQVILPIYQDIEHEIAKENELMSDAIRQLWERIIRTVRQKLNNRIELEERLSECEHIFNITDRLSQFINQNKPLLSDPEQLGLNQALIDGCNKLRIVCLRQRSLYNLCIKTQKSDALTKMMLSTDENCPPQQYNNAFLPSLSPTLMLPTEEESVTAIIPPPQSQAVLDVDETSGKPGQVRLEMVGVQPALARAKLRGRLTIDTRHVFDECQAFTDLLNLSSQEYGQRNLEESVKKPNTKLPLSIPTEKKLPYIPSDQKLHLNQARRRMSLTASARESVSLVISDEMITNLLSIA